MQSNNTNQEISVSCTLANPEERGVSSSVNEGTVSSSVVERNKNTETQNPNPNEEPSVLDVHGVAHAITMRSSSNSVPKTDPDGIIHGDPGDETVAQSSLGGGCTSDSAYMSYFARPVQVHHCDIFNFPSISDCACDRDGLGGTTADLEAHFNNDYEFKPFHYSDFTD